MFLSCIKAHCSRVTIFCCLNAQHFSSSWAYAKREGKCWAWRATKYCDTATMSQDTTEKHCLSNEEWQLKILIIEYHILFCAIVHDFSWNFNFTESEVKSIFYWYSTTLWGILDSVSLSLGSVSENLIQFTQLRLF